MKPNDRNTEQVFTDHFPAPAKPTVGGEPATPTKLVHEFVTENTAPKPSLPAKK